MSYLLQANSPSGSPDRALVPGCPGRFRLVISFDHRIKMAPLSLSLLALPHKWTLSLSADCVSEVRPPPPGPSPKPSSAPSESPSGSAFLYLPSLVNSKKACPRLAQFYILGPGTPPQSPPSATLAERHHNRQVALPITGGRLPQKSQITFLQSWDTPGQSCPDCAATWGKRKPFLSLKLKFLITCSPCHKWEEIPLPLQAECFSPHSKELQDGHYSITSNFFFKVFYYF